MALIRQQYDDVVADNGRLLGEIRRLTYEFKLSEDQYQAEAKHSIRLETALKEIIRVIDHEQPLGNGHRLREIAQAALGRRA